MTWHDDVSEFHRAMGCWDGDRNNIPPEVLQLRRDLIHEEYLEVLGAFAKQDLVLLADGLADLCYVTFGTAVTLNVGPRYCEPETPINVPGMCDQQQQPGIVGGISDAVYMTLRGLHVREMSNLIDHCITAAEYCDFDLRPVWDAVHASNMLKTTGPVRADGKRLKPEGWQPPDIAGVLRAQGWENAA